MGLTSRSGVIPLSTLADIAGPMTRTLEDAVTVLQVIAGRDVVRCAAPGSAAAVTVRAAAAKMAMDFIGPNLITSRA